jgi:ketosteroid isomerase-like protein
VTRPLPSPILVGPISAQTLDLARQYVETWNADGIDGTEHLRHPEMELYDPPDFPDAGHYSGRAAVRDTVEGYLALGWDGQFGEPEYLEAGDEVLVLWHMTGRSAHGVPLELIIGHLYLFEDDQVRRVRQYMTPESARQGAGLPAPQP